MRKLWIGAVVAGIAIAGAALVAIGTGAQDAARSAGLLAWQDADVVALGAEVYAQNCAACHGADLEGEPDWQIRGEDGMMPAPPHDETGHTWHHADAMLIGITTQGTAAYIGGGYQSNMPGFGGSLSEAEIGAALAYIKSTWPAEVIEIHDQINADFAARSAP